MRSRKRILSIAAVVLALSAVAATFAITAKADPASLAVEGENGYKTQRVYHPNGVWYVDLAVDMQRGFQDETLDTYLSGVARISRGPGALRVQVDAIRGAIGSYTATDFYPAKEYLPRDNTPGGIGGPCTTSGGGNVNLYADVSQQVGCQKGPNRLNSDLDYAGNVVLVRGYGDWFPTGTALSSLSCSVTMATRGFFAVRWNNGDYTQLSLRTNTVPANPNC